MNSGSRQLGKRWKAMVGNRYVWVLVLITVLVGTTFLHYCTPQTRIMASYPLTRHAAERILFILGIVGATMAFGYAVGLAMLALVVVLMLPRALFISPHPVDALVEVIATTIIGYVLVWISGSRQRAVARVKTINAITTMLIQSLELEQILNGVLDKVLEVTHAETGAIYLVNEEQQGLSLVAHRNLPPELLADTDGARSARKLARHQALVCQLAVPLRSKDTTNGLLVIANSQPCPTLQREVKLLSTISNEIGVVVENARLFQDVARQLETERCVCKVVEEITSELELDKVLPKVMRMAEELVGADGGIVALWDEDMRVTTYPYLHNLPQELAAVTVEKGEGLSGEVMTTGRSIVIDDYRTYPKAVPAFVQAGLGSVVAVPITNGPRTFGALSVCSINRAKRFSEANVAILTAIGRQAGIAIENAYLYENLRFYARRITRAQENERKRIARELHDDTIQPLIVLARSLEILAGSDPSLPRATIKRLRELRSLTGDLIQRVRRFSHDLRPSILDDLGLLPALEELTAELGRQTGLQTEFKVLGPKRRLSSEVELTLFRIAQEALSNIRRHARASAMALTVEFVNSTVRMTVQDDGRGFTPPNLSEHLATADRLGLVGMYERAQLIGGTLSVESAPNRGTKVTVKVPI